MGTKKTMRARLARAGQRAWALARRRPSGLVLALLFASALAPRPARAADPGALPAGGQVVGGQATISSPSAGALRVDQQSQRAAINWDSFNVGAAARVQFNQPGASSVALNRVVGGNPSEIVGRIDANGQVFLVNPSGVLFAKGSQVNAAGLAASSLDVDPKAFMAGSNVFSGSSSAGAVRNEGTLAAAPGGYVALIAPQVSNAGTISAPSGSAAMAAGTQATLQVLGSSLISMSVDQGAVAALVANGGAVLADGGQVLLTAKGYDALSSSVVNNSGIARADTIGQSGGVVRISSSMGAINSGTISASGTAPGAKGGQISIEARSAALEGRISADGAAGGGSVAVAASHSIAQTASDRTSADSSSGAGGSVSLVAGSSAAAGDGALLSGKSSADGASLGGKVAVGGASIDLAAATLSAVGGQGGGTVLVGGGAHGASLDGSTPNARSVSVNSSASIDVSARDSGSAGQAVVWSDGQTRFSGQIAAKGGAAKGDGGWVEVSGKAGLGFDGKVDASAAAGKAGSLLLDPTDIVITSAAPYGAPMMDLPDPNPGANNHFGDSFLSLANGNIAATSPGDSFAGSGSGATYLFNGYTGALISATRGQAASDAVGSGGLTQARGNTFVISSPRWSGGGASQLGAVTFVDAAGAGLPASISAANSLVGSSANDQVGSGAITRLSNGNVAVASPNWSSTRGAVSVVDGALGASGAVSASNSLVGSQSGDLVGAGKTVELGTSGKFVATSPAWANGGAASAGAATVIDSAAPTVGSVSASNSLVGSSAGDQVGSGAVAILGNGNAVVASPNWNSSSGAATWISRSSPAVGAVSAANSLVGATAGDQVGSGMLTTPGAVALTNGNYVVSSPRASILGNAQAGAATWGDGLHGTVGYATPANSLHGLSAGDNVGQTIAPLTNGNYVVGSPGAKIGGVAQAGAATWASGTGATSAAVDASNSLVGSSFHDQVGLYVNPLANGNYVVRSPNWNNPAAGASGAGAVTWGNGAGGTVGAVGATNSYVGANANDNIGYENPAQYASFVAFSNGNYAFMGNYNGTGPNSVLGSVTWGNGNGGSAGAVDASNSLVGSTHHDTIGSSGMVEVGGGKFVIMSDLWDIGNGPGAFPQGKGAVTMGSTSGPITGPINSSTTTMFGQIDADRLGIGGVNQTGVAKLPNGDFYLINGEWGADATHATVGAVTLIKQGQAFPSAVPAAGSLTGAAAGDGAGHEGAYVFGSGRVATYSPWFANGSSGSGGAITWIDPANNKVGALSAANSIFNPGTFYPNSGHSYGSYSQTPTATGADILALPYADNAGFSGSGRVIVFAVPGTPASSVPFAQSSGSALSINPLAIQATLNTGASVSLQASNDITVSSAISSAPSSGNGGSLTLQAGRGVNLNANVSTANGSVSILANAPASAGVVDADRSAGAGGIHMAGGAAIDAGSGSMSLRVGSGAGLTNGSAGTIDLAIIHAGSLSVDSAAFAASLTANNKVYDSTAAATLSSFSVSGLALLPGSNLALDAPTARFADKNVGTAKTVASSPIQIHGFAGSNASDPRSTLSVGGVPLTASGTASISPRPLDIAGSKAYDGTAAFAGSALSASNVVGGDSVSLSGAATTSSAAVGPYTSFATNALTSSNANYSTTGGSVNVSIAAVPAPAPAPTPSAGGDPARDEIVCLEGSTTAQQHCASRSVGDPGKATLDRGDMRLINQGIRMPEQAKPRQ